MLWGASGAQEGASGDVGGMGGSMGWSVGAKGKRRAVGGVVRRRGEKGSS